MEGMIQIVNREAIPSIHEVTQGNDVHVLGEVRDFRWSEPLRAFMPDASEFSVSWVGLGDGEVLQPHVHPIQSLMVVYAGHGEVMGDLCRTLSIGDIVVVPAGCVHGFIGGIGGLFALSIQFGEGLYSDPQNARVIFVDSGHSLDGLLVYNKSRLDELTQHPLFELLAERRASAAWREQYLANLGRVFDLTRILLARQVSCRDPRFEPEFARYLQTRLLAPGLRPGAPEGYPTPASSHRRDPLVTAFSDWFTYQMYVLDNVEKTAIVHLVLEPASLAFQTRLAAILGTDSPWPRSNEGSEDAAGFSTGQDLLRHQTLDVNKRLEKVTREAWDMLRALADRIVDLGRTTK